MSLAGAPPPPPPPPPPPHPPQLGQSFDSLPAELLLSIIQYLHKEDYVGFALAIYPILQQHGLVPPLTADVYFRITQPRSTLVGTPSVFRRVPNELIDLIMRHLEPADVIAFLFSHRDLFLRYLPALSKRTRKRLWKCTDLGES